MKESYEVITYKNTGLHMFLVDLQYRTPHFHRDIEISAILEGELDFIYSGGRKRMCAGDFYITNPFQLHEFSGPKYMKKGFTKIYGCTPKEYRRAFHVDVRDIAPEDTITSQNIMSPEVCLTLLETKYAPR